MGLADWNITGSGGQAVIDYGGSMRCQLSGHKLMLWNGRDNLANSEVIALIRMGVDTNTRGGLILRSNLSANSCYRLRIYGKRVYYIQKIVDGVVTTLAAVGSMQPYNVFTKTRFRVDGYQLSVEEWIDGAWQLVSVAEDTGQSLATGYAGIYAEGVSTYATMFDDVEIAERV